MPPIVAPASLTTHQNFRTQNHEVWVRGEPAFVKVWLDTPATLQGSGVLQGEEGFSQVRASQTLCKRKT